MNKGHHGAAPTLRLLSLCLFLTACAPTLRSPGPDIVQARLTEKAFVTSDNARLMVKRWLPEKQATKAVVIALHGFNDHANFFDLSGRALKKQGIASFAYDQRGFGHSQNRGLWAGSYVMAQDLKNFIPLIKKHYPKTPIYLLGTSMGGAVVILTMTELEPPKVDGIILVAPAIWAKKTMPWYQRWVLSLASYTLPWLKLTGKGLDITASDNKTMLKQLAADPLVIKQTRIDAMHGLTHLMSLALERAKKLKSRALIMYGQRDEIIPKGPTMTMLQNLPEKAKNKQKIVFYKHGYHMLLRDLNAHLVRQDIITWIKDAQQSLPSGADLRPVSK
jgi:acylglycerol lipase